MAEMKDVAVKEPLIHITKRTDIASWKKVVVRVSSVLIAFLLCGVLAFLLVPKLAESPARIGEFYRCFIVGNFRNANVTWTTFKDLAILLCISLAITPAFKMKFWNIGAEGQVLVGVLAAEGIAFKLGGTMPEFLLLVFMFLGALTAGAVWGVIPALCKAKWGTNETLFTLMMNYVATLLVDFFIALWITNGSQIMPPLANGLLPTAVHPYFLIILIVFLLAIAMFVYFNYSKHGYEISVVGESVNTAKYVGINVTKVIIRTMLLSGALCGFTGFLIGAGLNHSVSSTAVGGKGFTAIMVSWLAKFSPVFMILTAGLIVFLERGASEVASVFFVPNELTDIFVGLTLFFVIGSEFFLQYQVHFRAKKSKEKEAQA